MNLSSDSEESILSARRPVHVVPDVSVGVHATIASVLLAFALANIGVVIGPE